MSDSAGKRRSDGLSPNLDALSPKLAGLSPNLKRLSHNLIGVPGPSAQVTATRRRRDTIRDYLARMVRNGRLALKFPEQPNHPQQAYRAVGRA